MLTGIWRGSLGAPVAFVQARAESGDPGAQVVLRRMEATQAIIEQYRNSPALARLRRLASCRAPRPEAQSPAPPAADRDGFLRKLLRQR